MRYRLQRHDGTDCSATMVPITVLRMVPIQRYRQIDKIHIVEQKSSILQYILYQPYLLDLTRTLQTYFYKLSHLYQILLIEKATPIK